MEDVMTTEKITINMSVVDIGKVDLLVEEGFYSNRTDFIRTAIRNLLNIHAQEIESSRVRKSMVIGITGFSRDDLLARLEAGEVLEIRTMGMAVIGERVTPDLALATIQSIKVLGVLKAPEDVKSALAEAGRLI
nr:CopG family transcriptional regulator [Anaerolineae bacterium]